MKQFLLAVLLMAAGCMPCRKYVLLPYRHAYNEGNQFRDSLIRSGTDTILSYCYAPAGGMHGLVTDYYVYWVSNDSSFLKRFSTLTDFRTITKETFDLSYISRYINDAAVEHVKPGYEIPSHYKSHEYMFLKIGTKGLHFDMVSYEKDSWKFGQRQIFIDKFRSFLFGISDWEGLHYRKQRKNQDY